jgi:putative ABC transport system substrate-binding protein
VVTRRAFIGTLAGGLLAAPLAAEAQPAGKVWRIGYLGSGSASGQGNRADALRAGLRELGYVEGKNIVIEYRWAEGKYDRLPDLAAELVNLKVDILVTAGTPGTLAAKQATTTIPIVMAGTGDAVATGLVSSLARPGGNITGSTDSVPELMAKQLELLKEIMPRTGRVAVLVNPGNLSRVPVLKAMETTAKSLKVELQKFEVREPNELETAFSTMAKSRVDAVVVTTDSLFNANVRTIADLAAKKRLLSAGTKEFAEAGGSIGYGLNFSAISRRAAYFVDKILRGAKPADLPVEQPTQFELVINLKTARALGLTVPPSLLGRADQVIQ